MSDLTPDLEQAVKGVEDQFARIHKDLSHNVTRIYGRDDILIATDLIFHSVLSFNFLGEIVHKGWVEGLIIGDTGCGKTKTVSSLAHHYRAGEIVTGESCTFAGLVGGAQQLMGKAWSITWGRIPLRDKTLVIIDEVSGMNPEDIGAMSSMRSEGIAQITKIHQEKTFARTRLIWISNPRRRRLMTYNSGIDAIRELIGRPEDIRRFDFAITVASQEVPSSEFNRRRDSESVPHIFTSALCHGRVMWAWSRRPEQVMFTPEAEDLILTRAEEMGKVYHASIPLVEPADQRIKIARLAAATAARVYSTDANGIRLIVKPEHVEFSVRFLHRAYKKPSMAYDLYSRQRYADEKLEEEEKVETLIVERGRVLVDALLDSPMFSQSDIEMICNIDRSESRELLSLLVRYRCLKRSRNGLFKTPAFIALLKQLQTRGDLTEGPAPKDDGEPAPF